MKRRHNEAVDMLQVFGNIPDILGMELTMHRQQWQGRYYITGQRHPWRRDKLKVWLWNGKIYLREEGGVKMNLPTWLITYGGAMDYNEAFRIIRSGDRGSATFTQSYVGGCTSTATEKFVSDSEYAEYSGFSLWECPLYRWMCGLFGNEKTSEVWQRYKVTTDERGLVVWWYLDAEGRVCYDKRMRYSENGHRDKAFGGTRRYRVGDGYTAKPMFGAHLIAPADADGAESSAEAVGVNLGASDGILSQEWIRCMPNIENALKSQKINVVESEKTALLASMAFGGTWVATGGKSNLRGIDSDMLLWADVDAANEWSDCGNVCEWWLDAEKCGISVGEHWDIGDLIVAQRRRGTEFV